MSAHTPEPWHTESQCPGECCWHLFSGPIYGAGDGGECISSPEMSQADAARIVACVNACAGMGDPAAEIARLHSAVAELSHESVTFQGQRDALAAALRDVLPLAIQTDCGGMDVAFLLNNARAALAKLDGKP